MRALICIALLVLSAASDAKCVYQPHEVSGRVLSDAGLPIGGAQVTASWQERGEPKTASALSDANGRYAVIVQFNTYSGAILPGLDLCKGMLASIHVVASAASYSEVAVEVSPAKPLETLDLVLKKLTQ
jgi:hypothetical protein